MTGGVKAHHTAHMETTIWHNPSCSTSRKVLGQLQAAGIEPLVVEYLNAPPSRAALAELIRDAGLQVREAIRQKEALYTQLGLGDPALDDDHLLDAMVENPVLIGRPFVRTPLGTRLCRPAERLHEVLPGPA